MELKWTRDKDNDDINLHYLDKDRLVGWIRRFSDGQYNVSVSSALGLEVWSCEEQKFVTLRQAMRALKETVTVLLVGRSYGT
jgi:hypothetical protein